MEKRMRRFKQLLPLTLTREILIKTTNGILSLIDADGEPYGVPLSFAFDNKNGIYFHSAPTGRKIDCIDHNQSCSFCVVQQDCVVPEEFTSYFRSVIVKGIIQRVSDREEIIKGLLLLCEKYSPGINPENEIARCLKHVAVYRMDIEEMTGKEAIELVRSREKKA